jgi:peptidoglycan/LPS O-acetylase OafA/YrhL
VNNLSITAWNPKIEGLRGFAILLVFIAHLSRDGSHQWGALGVGIFFIISGYVITGSISKLILSTTPPRRNNAIFTLFKSFLFSTRKSTFTSCDSNYYLNLRCVTL